MKLFKVGVLVVFLLTLALANVAVGQSLTLGGIGGRIVDPAGAVVPNATVELKSLDTGSTQTTTTSGEGTYRFNLLKPGRYEVTVAVSGFAKVVQSTHGIRWSDGGHEMLRGNFKDGETIEVSAAAPTNQHGSCIGHVAHT